MCVSLYQNYLHKFIFFISNVLYCKWGSNESFEVSLQCKLNNYHPGMFEIGYTVQKYSPCLQTHVVYVWDYWCVHVTTNFIQISSTQYTQCLISSELCLKTFKCSSIPVVFLSIVPRKGKTSQLHIWTFWSQAQLHLVRRYRCSVCYTYVWTVKKSWCPIFLDLGSA